MKKERKRITSLILKYGRSGLSMKGIPAVNNIQILLFHLLILERTTHSSEIFEELDEFIYVLYNKKEHEGTPFKTLHNIYVNLYKKCSKHCIDISAKDAKIPEMTDEQKDIIKKKWCIDRINIYDSTDSDMDVNVPKSEVKLSETFSIENLEKFVRSNGAASYINIYGIPSRKVYFKPLDRDNQEFQKELKRDPIGDEGYWDFRDGIEIKCFDILNLDFSVYVYRIKHSNNYRFLLSSNVNIGGIKDSTQYFTMQMLTRIEEFISSGLKTKDIEYVVNVKEIKNHRDTKNVYSKGLTLVKGHVRHYKSGKIVFIKPHIRNYNNIDESVELDDLCLIIDITK